MSRRQPVDEQQLRALFEEIDAPPTLDRWRTKAEPAESAPIPDLPVLERWVRPPRPRMRTIAAAAAAFAVVLGLAGVVVANQLLTDEPPANPPMIIDGPDRVTTPPTGDRSVPSSPPPPSSGASSTSGGPVHTDPGNPDGGPVREDPGGPLVPPPDPGPGGSDEVEPPPMVGYPTAANAGVPAGTILRGHTGDLHITQPRTVISTARVNGVIVVDAPDVTLRRVMVSSRNGISVRQTARAARLTIELSDLVGEVVQEAGGLTIRRCTTAGVRGIGDLSVVDTYFGPVGQLRITGTASRITLRHNTIEQVVLADATGPITDVTVEDNSLSHLSAPTQPGSANIRVRRNEFRSTPVSTGWNDDGPGYEWTGNTDQNGASVGP